jgi:hypothetical protein
MVPLFDPIANQVELVLRRIVFLAWLSGDYFNDL